MSAAPTLADWDLTAYFTDVATPDFATFRDRLVYASFDWGMGCGTLFETCGDELSFVRSQAPDTIWTLISVDGCETIASGYHFANRLGYFICRTRVERGLTVEVPLDFEE